MSEHGREDGMGQKELVLAPLVGVGGVGVKVCWGFNTNDAALAVGWQHSRGAKLWSMSLCRPINHSQSGPLQYHKGAGCTQTRWS